MHPKDPITFQSFFQGGFESASHCRRDGLRLDVLASSRHDVLCAADYRLLQSVGIRTVRDALRWHRIERTPGHFDWTSFLPMLQAARDTGTEVIWDLCHWGVPDGLNPFSQDFPGRFARYATAAVKVIHDFHRENAMGPPAICAINEVSFWSWVGGDVEHFAPYGAGQGHQLKQQLARASILALRTAREVCPEARLVQPEPLIHIAADIDHSEDAPAAAAHTEAQFQTVDMILGRMHPEFGGDEDLLDVLGVNYYWNNQWLHNGPRAPLGHRRHRPLHLLLQDLWQRYGKPLLITETGAEDDCGAGWLGYLMAEVRQAQALGVPVQGVCLYPVMDYPGWDDDRHCPVGLLRSSGDWTSRTIDGPLLRELQLQESMRSVADISER